MTDKTIDKDRLEHLRFVASNPGLYIPTTEGRCLFKWLQKQTKSVWTKEKPGSYACKSCVNTHRLCMSIAQRQVYVLPLHPHLRVPSGGEQASGGVVSDKDAAKVRSD